MRKKKVSAYFPRNWLDEIKPENCALQISFKGRLNTDTSPQNFRAIFLKNDLEQKKKSTLTDAIAIPLPL